LWPDESVQTAARERALTSGATITLTDRPEEGLSGVEFVHTDVWVSMGEPKEVWELRARELLPYQVNGAALSLTANSSAKVMHCLPAFHDETTTMGRDVADLTGIKGGLEVTDEVFNSPANIAFDQAENRLHTIKSLMVATLS
jgi:ornithine carbamoyltransferase